MSALLALTHPRPVLISLLALALAATASGAADSATDRGSPSPPSEQLREPALERVGAWPYGQALAVSVDEARRLVFLGSGGAVLVLDAQDIAHPQLLSESIRTLGLVLDACYDHATQRLFLACGEGGLEIWDVADPSNPTRLVNYEVLEYGFETPVDAVEVSGHYAIVDCSWGYVKSLDVSDPTHPVIVGGSGQMGNPANDIFLAKGGYLHTVGAQAYYRFQIDPSTGQLHSNGFFDQFTGSAFLVAGSNDTAYVVQGGYIWVLDPEDPFGALSVYYVGSNVNDIDVSGNYVYFTRLYELVILDASNPYSLFQVGSISISGGARAIEVDGDLVHLAGGYAGLRAIDVTDPGTPSEAGAYETLSRTVTVKRRGDYAYLAEHDDGVLIIDLTDLAEPDLAGQYDTPGYTYDVEIAGDLLYVADYDGGLRIADLSANPTAPTEISHLNLGQVHQVAVDGDYAYVIDEIVNQSDILRVVDVSDPYAPIERGSILIPGEARTMDPDGNYLYVAADDAGLRVLDVSNPDAPVEVANYLAPDVLDVQVVGDRAYLGSADWDGGFLTLDVSNPLNPILISRYYETGRFFWDVEVIGDFAYVTAPSTDLLYLLHLADEENPVRLGTYVTPGALSDVTASDSLALVADGSAGLLILENLLYSTPGGGVGWEVLSSGTPEHLRDVHFANVSAGCVVGDAGTVLTTDDGGDSWQPRVSGTTEDLFAVHFADPLTGWIGGRGGVLRKSTDGGASWMPQTSGTSEQIRDLYFLDSQNGWAACTGGQLRHTTNGGQTWQPQVSGTTSSLSSIDFIDENHGWISTHGDGLLLQTTNGGASWSPRYLPTAARLSSVSFVDAMTGWVSTWDATILKTVDGGTSWAEQFSDENTPYSGLNDIQFVDASQGWVIGSVALEGRSYATSNGGETWTEMHGGREHYLQRLYFVDARHGWTVGQYGTILRAAPAPTTSLPPGDGTATVPGVASVSLSVRPNPFNPACAAHFAIPEAADLKLDVFDVTGRHVAGLARGRFDAGEHVIPWDGHDDRGQAVPSGIYFLRLEAGDRVVATKRAVVLR